MLRWIDLLARGIVPIWLARVESVSVLTHVVVDSIVYAAEVRFKARVLCHNKLQTSWLLEAPVTGVVLINSNCFQDIPSHHLMWISYLRE